MHGYFIFRVWRLGFCLLTQLPPLQEGTAAAAGRPVLQVAGRPTSAGGDPAARRAAAKARLQAKNAKKAEAAKEQPAAKATADGAAERAAATCALQEVGGVAAELGLPLGLGAAGTSG